jgi:cation diffusion facilitator family transporter
MAGHANSVKPIFYALGANFAIFVAKLGAAIVTGSSAMLAEAVHSLADCGNQGLLLIGVKQSKRPPSPDYPLGYGKAIYFWSFLVALVLFSMGGAFSLYEGWHKLHEPTPVTAPWIAVGVLVFGIVAEGFSMWGCLREVNKARGTRSLWRWFRDSRQSELIVIFGEDLAALFGLVFALIAVVLTVITGNPLFDALGTLAIGSLLVVVAVFIAIEVKALLIGQSADPRQHAEIEQFLADRPEIANVLNLITLQLGADVMVAVKARLHVDAAKPDMAASINRVEVAHRTQFPYVRWSFFEPDTTD